MTAALDPDLFTDSVDLPTVSRSLRLAEGAPPRVVLAYGLGADSSAILARWLTEPASRDFDLDDLVVITGIISSSP